nr:hypothetical protein [Halotalea alkalilenta]
MAQILHSRAKTVHAIRKEIQRSKASVAALSRRYGLNPKTVRKWRARDSVEDVAMGPKRPRSHSLAPLEESAALEFRRRTLHPLDDCLFTLQRFIPHLTRAKLHRLYQRHEISRLPEDSHEQPTPKRFKSYRIGYLHIDFNEIRTGEGKAYLFVAVDRTSKFVHAKLNRQAGRNEAAAFL